jgi:hypothetical protein
MPSGKEKEDWRDFSKIGCQVLLSKEVVLGHPCVPVRHSKAPLFKFLVPTYYGDISFFDAHLLGEEKNEFAVR